MKKEVLLSIIIGFGIGLAATFGLYTARKTYTSSNQIQSPIPDQESQATGTPLNTTKSLSLISPIDQSIIKEGKVLIAGVTSPEIPILILYEKGEKLVTSDKKGNFEIEVTLDSGENQIEVQSLFDNGDKVNKTVTVVYTTAEI